MFAFKNSSQFVKKHRIDPREKQIFGQGSDNVPTHTWGGVKSGFKGQGTSETRVC